MIYTDSFKGGVGGVCYWSFIKVLFGYFMWVTVQTFGLPQIPYYTVHVSTASRVKTQHAAILNQHSVWAVEGPGGQLTNHL